VYNIAAMKQFQEGFGKKLLQTFNSKTFKVYNHLIYSHPTITTKNS